MKFCLLGVLGPLGSAEIPIQIGFLHCDPKSLKEHSRGLRIHRALTWSSQPLLPSLPFGHVLSPHGSVTLLREVPAAVSMPICSPRSAHYVHTTPRSAPHSGKLLSVP